MRADELGVVRQVILQLIIAPARNAVLGTVARFEEPNVGIQLRTIELIAPDQGQSVAW